VAGKKAESASASACHGPLAHAAWEVTGCCSGIVLQAWTTIRGPAIPRAQSAMWTSSAGCTWRPRRFHPSARLCTLKQSGCELPVNLNYPTSLRRPCAAASARHCLVRTKLWEGAGSWGMLFDMFCATCRWRLFRSLSRSWGAWKS
jgi:hypothetical protein